MTRSLCDRRTVLGLSGTVLATSLVGCSSRTDDQTTSKQNTATESRIESTTAEATESATATSTTATRTIVENPSLQRIGHTLLSDPGEYAEGSIRADGRLGVLGSHRGQGSFLVDIADPTAPRELHHLPAAENVQNLDVKFDPRDGLYYRTEEPLEEANAGGIEVVDYGYRRGSKRNPVIVGRLEAGSTHNLCVHPDVPIVYAINTFVDEERSGLEVWNVETPMNPTKIRGVWSKSGFHDVVFDPGRERLHCASAEGYGLLDASDPARPTPLGWFAYDGKPEYTAVGTAGFENGHYADFDPRRELAVVGDELTTGVPGGKHVFDIGWRDGSPKDPIPVGFTHSPNAKPRDPETDHTVWTTHNHDVVPYGERTLLVSGDYSEGIVLYDITDPTNPHAIDRHPTTARAEAVSGGRAPRAWSATYNRERDLVFASDIITGAYTLRIG